MYRSKFRMNDMTLRKALVISCDMFFRDQLRSTRGIALFVSDRGRVDDVVGAI